VSDGQAVLEAALTRFEDAWAVVEAAPSEGALQLIVRRPAVDQRESLGAGRLDPAVGLEGDGWLARGSSRSADGRPDPDTQLTLISTRVLAAIEPEPGRWPLAGDQLYVDVDLSLAGLPPGSRLAVGEAVVELSETPHTGCAKFSARFGSDALRWINSPRGRELRMRGANARVVRGGVVRVGDAVRPL
jgi:MOSC domain-containing protein YiiM